MLMGLFYRDSVKLATGLQSEGYRETCKSKRKRTDLGSVLLGFPSSAMRATMTHTTSTEKEDGLYVV
jgi:hypothetical protein